MTNTTAQQKMERVRSEGGCQESWIAHNEKGTKSNRSENQKIWGRALGIIWVMGWTTALVESLIRSQFQKVEIRKVDWRSAEPSNIY